MKVTSSSEWMDLIASDTFVVNYEISDPYSMVSALDIVVSMAMPLELTIMQPFTPLCVFILFSVSCTFWDIVTSF